MNRKVKDGLEKKTLRRINLNTKRQYGCTYVLGTTKGLEARTILQ